jgi:NAD(P)H-dependent FMN reductase
VATTLDSALHLQVILGSVREGRRSEPVARWVCEKAQAYEGVAVELIDLKAWSLPIFDLAKFPSEGNYEDPLQQRWAASVAKADGFIFVTPEYNHGYTPALKNALDYLYAEWNRKPASFVSFGNAEGARGIEQLKLVLNELEVAALPTALPLRGVAKKIATGTFLPEEAETKRFGVVFDEWLWWARALKAARKSG